MILNQTRIILRHFSVLIYSINYLTNACILPILQRFIGHKPLQADITFMVYDLAMMGSWLGCIKSLIVCFLFFSTPVRAHYANNN